MKKKPNLLRFVYGELFLCSLTTTKSSMIVDSWKAYAWTGILKWLLEHNHISALSVDYVDKSKRRINYIFNHNNVIYPQHLRYLQRLVDDRNISIAI